MATAAAPESIEVTKYFLDTRDLGMSTLHCQADPWYDLVPLNFLSRDSDSSRRARALGRRDAALNDISSWGRIWAVRLFNRNQLFEDLDDWMDWCVRYLLQHLDSALVMPVLGRASDLPDQPTIRDLAQEYCEQEYYRGLGFRNAYADWLARSPFWRRFAHMQMLRRIRARIHQQERAERAPVGDPSARPLAVAARDGVSHWGRSPQPQGEQRLCPPGPSVGICLAVALPPSLFKERGGGRPGGVRGVGARLLGTAG